MSETCDNINVCLINDSFPPEVDGVANAVVNYARLINEKYGSAQVAAPKHPDADDTQLDFPVIRYPSIDMTRQVGYTAGFPFSAPTVAELQKYSPEIIHTHSPLSATMLARILRDRMDIPVIFTYHTRFDIEIAHMFKGRFIQNEAARALVENISACNEVWTVSRGAGENLRNLGYQGKYTVMPNGVDFPRGRVPDELIKEVTAGYDLPEGIPVFLYIGRLMWYKGIRIILDALQIFKAKGSDFRMVFVGGGLDKDDIAAYTEGLGLNDKVFFAPALQDREQIRAWYCRADLFLFPSTFDTNGLVVREAAACSLASVLIKGSCAAEDVTDGVDGFLIDENAEAMEALLEVLSKDMSAAKRAGMVALERLYLSWDDSVATAVEAYRDVIDDFKRGLYQRGTTLSDEIFHSLANTIGMFNNAKLKRQLFFNDLKNGLTGGPDRFL